jgi:predicted ATPase
MSDGMLRFLAIGAALLSAPLTKSKVSGQGEPAGQRTLVIEEIENGLHPTMAAQVVELVKNESTRRRIRTIVTTHSPPLLDALEGDDHPGVIVFDRDKAGWSRARRLVDLPGYPELIAAGGLGTGIVSGGLTDAADERPAISDEFNRLLVGM